MQLVCTLFDPNRDGRPLMTGVLANGKVDFHSYYLPKTGKSIYEIEQGLAALSHQVEGDVLLNDYKRHLIGFNFNPSGRVYDAPIELPPDPDPRKAVARGLLEMKKCLEGGKAPEWMRIRAEAAIVYKYLQDKGVLLNYEHVHPQWHLDVFSGRSRAAVVGVQGATPEDLLCNVNGDSIYINFDFVSADLRAAAIMSGDPVLEESFCSDPYSYLAEIINRDIRPGQDPLSRDEAKLGLFQPFYALDADSDILAVYPTLRDWMAGCKEQLERDKYLVSALGRKFYLSERRDAKSVFNATLQGTVAHAMQASIRRVWDKFPDNILLENHDSLVMTAKDADHAKRIINTVVPIMVQPFRGLLPSNPTFPVAVSIGAGYKKWKQYKRYDAAPVVQSRAAAWLAGGSHA
jgi:hypothetical protein